MVSMIAAIYSCPLIAHVFEVPAESVTGVLGLADRVHVPLAADTVHARLSLAGKPHTFDTLASKRNTCGRVAPAAPLAS